MVVPLSSNPQVFSRLTVGVNDMTMTYKFTIIWRTPLRPTLLLCQQPKRNEPLALTVPSVGKVAPDGSVLQ